MHIRLVQSPTCCDVNELFVSCNALTLATLSANVRDRRSLCQDEGKPLCISFWRCAGLRSDGCVLQQEGCDGQSYR